MSGLLSLVLHAHLPFVRHPEHDKFLEEYWLFEAVTECYLPLLGVFRRWEQDGMDFRLTMTMSPTLCSMLRDPLLQSRCRRYLEERVRLSEKEVFRTHWTPDLNALAHGYLAQFRNSLALYEAIGLDLTNAFRELQDRGRLEIITCAATHALLPLLAAHPPSVRAQILTARDHYIECFGRPPKGIWLPECAYTEELEPFLQEAGIRWFILDTHGLLHGAPQPRYGTFAPAITPNGIVVFGRDSESAKQVWSRDEGYPGDPRYRDFYRDVGFDADYDYIKPFLPAPPQRAFTGIKYHRITGPTAEKEPYDAELARQAADEHAGHFLRARLEQVRRLSGVMDRAPLLVCPYDAELFGHWWSEGPQFLDYFVRKTWFDQKEIKFTHLSEYLDNAPPLQVIKPSSSSWGEEGYWKIWMNENNEWIYRHLYVAQERMSELARRFPNPNPLIERALRQAGRELLLAQSSDWPFILQTGSSPEYAQRRIKDHLLRFLSLHDQLTSTGVDDAWLRRIEAQDNLFPSLNYHYWA